MRIPAALQKDEGLGKAYAWTERMMGNFAQGRYGWVFSQIEMLKEPISCRGYQQLFDVEM